MPRIKATVRMELNEIPSFPGAVEVSESGSSREAAGFTDGGGKEEKDLEMQQCSNSQSGCVCFKVMSSMYGAHQCHEERENTKVYGGP